MELKEIKQQLTINQVLQHYGLKPDKNQRLICPFHPDKNPSLQVFPKTNTYCCFSSNCNAGTGDAIQFIELYEKCSKHDALVKAAELAGGEVAKPQAPAAMFVETDSLTKTAVLTKAFTIFKNSLPRNPKAIAYLQSRNLNHSKNPSDKQIETGFINAGYRHELGKELTERLAKHGLLILKPAGGYANPGNGNRK